MSKARRLIFRLLTVLLLLAVAEVAARVAFAAKGEPPPVADESLENEWEWAKKHLAAGSAVLESDLDPHPTLGWRLRPGLRRAELRTNSAGMRNDGELAPEPRADERRLLLVGDSYTFGHGNTNEETYAHRLATMMPGWSVMNCGVPGYGTDQQVLAFEQAWRGYQPRVVALGFFVRDYSRNTLRFRDYAKPRFLPEGDFPGLRLEGPPIPAPEVLFDEYASGRRRVGAGVGSYAWGAIGRSLRNLAAKRIDERAPGWIVLERLMARFQSSVRAAGAEPVWLIIPDGDALDRPDHRWSKIERMVEARAKGLDLRCVNVAPEFRAAKDVRVYRSAAEGGHLSAAGNELVAKEIHRFLTREKLLGP